MGLVSSSIPNLINGISQQSDVMRLSSQGEEQENAYPSIVEGLKKRPGTYHVAKLTASLLTEDAHIHTIKRDADEKYKMILTNQGIQVFDMNGVEKTVNAPNGLGYLTSTDPSLDFSCMTIADYTFIVNKTIPAQMDQTPSPSRGPEGIVFLKQGNAETDYTITVGSQTFTARLDSSESETMTAVDQLWTDIQAGLDDTVWEYAKEKTTFWFRRVDGADFVLKAEDSRSNTCIESFKGQTQRFSDLPTVAPAGFTLEVIGDNTSNFDNYYVEFQADNETASFDKGVWQETVKPGIPYKFDGSTMPHVLVREADGTFTFRAAEWDERKVGDDKSASEPTFVGRKINACYFYKNRLGFLSDENNIMSEATEFFNFWPTTVTTLVDSDPIDTPAGSSHVSILNHVVPFKEDMIFFSDLDQFILSYGDVLSPKTADLEPITSFENSSMVAPVSSGKNVFFGVSRGNWSGIQEYYIDSEVGTRDAVDITSHVPKYIPGNLFRLTVSTNENVMLALTKDHPRNVFVYKYFWSGNEKVQSSWGKWTFSGDVLDADFMETEIFFVIRRSDGVYLEKMSIQPGHTEPDAPFEFHLDRKITEQDCTVIYDAPTNTTTWTLPYPTEAEVSVIVRYPGNGTHNPGATLMATKEDLTTFQAAGDYSATPVLIGEKYIFHYRFSKQTIKEASDGGGKSVVGQGRLQMRFWTVLYDETGFFQAKVTPLHRFTSTYDFTGRILGEGANVVGAVAIASGKFTFPVMAKNNEVIIDLYNDTFLPCRFLGAEWEANFTLRSKRV